MSLAIFSWKASDATMLSIKDGLSVMAVSRGEVGASPRMGWGGLWRGRGPFRPSGGQGLFARVGLSIGGFAARSASLQCHPSASGFCPRRYCTGREGPIAGTAIERGAGFEAGDVEHVSDGEKLLAIRNHGGVLSFVGMQGVPSYCLVIDSGAGSRKFMER
jgi:hypothetical protein